MQRCCDSRSCCPGHVCNHCDAPGWYILIQDERHVPIASVKPEKVSFFIDLCLVNYPEEMLKMKCNQ